MLYFFILALSFSTSTHATPDLSVCPTARLYLRALPMGWQNLPELKQRAIIGTLIEFGIDPKLKSWDKNEIRMIQLRKLANANDSASDRRLIIKQGLSYLMGKQYLSYLSFPYRGGDLYLGPLGHLTWVTEKGQILKGLTNPTPMITLQLSTEQWKDIDHVDWEDTHH